MPAEIPIPWTSYYSLGSLIYTVLELAFGLPDPLTEFLKLFDGRPKMQATAAIAGVLNRYSSPPIKFLALGACELVRRDIPVSSPDAAPIFGPYFKAALDIECGIRWSRRDASVERIEDQTLTVAMHEAGNPGVAGTATLQAMQQAWLQFQQGHFPGGASPLNYFTAMAQEAGTDPASLMEKGFANQYVGNIAPPPPPPGPPPPGNPPITVDIAQGQTVKGTVELKGYAISTIKNLVWLVDFHQVQSGFDGHWNSASVADGAHTLTVNGQDASGHVVASLTHQFHVNNHGAPSGTGNVRFNFAYGQTVSGTVTIGITVEGGPFPQAHVLLTANGQELASITDGTTGAAQPVTVSYRWDTTKVANGLYAITAKWIGHAGTVHGQLTSELAVDNREKQPTPPPPPVLEIPWENWFKVCSEVPQCQHISNDYLALAQATSNVAYAVYNLPKLWAQQPPDPCCDRVVSALKEVSEGLTASLHNLATLPNPAVLVEPLDKTAEALASINKALGGLNPDFTSLGKELDRFLAPLKEIADKICCPDLSKIEHELKRLNDDQQVPADWKRALINSKSLPPEMVQLLQSTIWDTAATALGASLGHVLGWGEAEIEGAAEKIGRYVIYPICHVVAVLWRDFLKGFNPEGGPAAHDIAHAATGLLKWVSEAIASAFGFAAETAVEFYEEGLAGIDTANEAGTKEATRLLLGKALHMGEIAHLLATLPEIPFFTKNLGVHEMAAFVAELAGFREVLVNTHRPLLYSKLGRPAAQVFNRKFPTALPGAGAGLTMWSRRLLTESDAQHVVRSAGFASHWDGPMFRAAYHPISPRALTTLMQDQPFDRARMREILQDNSYSDAHVDFMLDELEYASTKNVRNSYISEALTAYQKGVMPDHELNDILDSVGWSKEAKKFVTDRAALARRVTLAQKVEQQITQLVAQGLLEPETGLRHMEAAGIQEWYANLEITLATTKAELIAARKEATEELRQEHARQRNLTRAAVAEYQAGRANAAELSAALHLIGLDNTTAASIVALEEALRAGRVKLTYGQLLGPEDSAVLKERVAAIEQQTKDNLISLATARNQLQALKVPTDEIHALMARWAAQLKKAPGSAVLVNPITGALETNLVS